ncbi:hypothetical protein RRG08_003140 [Elysia crispata]|uniref:PiggyBac transposable element-derived protein domain-containing protein n=1 Tax=Elysia crispata TaxID=231223 RepID=A0AAE1B710_9GAST|nr:hypothetical protein RRG08_003140 [Elysia crispata]
MEEERVGERSDTELDNESDVDMTGIEDDSETLVAETNLYAAQCIAVLPTSSWCNTCVEEMRAFLCMQIMFGIRDRPRLVYWSEDKRFHDAFISSIVTINRFKNISQYFHCGDTANAPTRDQQGFDPLFKVRNIINTTQATFRAHFQAQRELNVDAAMVGFKGRLSFKQYMPVKPIKRVMGPAADGRPHPLIDYNRFMGVVDKLDQQQSYYPVGRPGK